MMSDNNLFDDDDNSNSSQYNVFMDEHSDSSQCNELNSAMGKEDSLCKGDDFAEIGDSELKTILPKSVYDSIDGIDRTIQIPEHLTAKKLQEANTIELLTKGKDEQKISFFQNKNKKNHVIVKQCIESQPEIVSMMVPFIRIYFCNFFDSTEEGLSLELLKLL